MKASELGTRVVLVKPGDVLVIGNLGEAFVPELLTEAMIKMKAATGIMILACYQDVTIGTMPGKLARALEWMRAKAISFADDGPNGYAESANVLEGAMIE